MVKLSTIFIIFGFINLFLFGYMHESVHKEIYRHYGINSKINLFDNGDMSTTPERNCDNEYCLLAHNLNEVVGYHLIAFYCLIFIGIVVIIKLVEGD